MPTPTHMHGESPWASPPRNTHVVLALAPSTGRAVCGRGGRGEDTLTDIGFWDGVQTILLEGDGIAFLLPDNRLVSAAEMDRRQRAYNAGRDPDAAFSPDVDRVDAVLGAIVSRERTARGLSQRQLAADSGVTQSMVARMEAGSREPSWRTFRLLLAAMALEPVVEVRSQTIAPSSGSESESESVGGPWRML